MNPHEDAPHPLLVTRRRFLGQAGIGIGAAALAELLQDDLFAQSATGGLAGLPHFAREPSA